MIQVKASKLKPKLKLFMLLCTLFCMTCAEGAQTTPRAQLDESERHLTGAHSSFLAQDYWNALEHLNRALRANTYLVDFYLMNGLNLQRIGELDEAQKSLAGYLEVRPMDSTAPRIQNIIAEQSQTLRRILSPNPLSARWRLSEPDLQKEWQAGFMRPFSIKGMGKAESLGNTVTLSDTLGNQVCLIANFHAGESIQLKQSENILNDLGRSLDELTGSQRVSIIPVPSPAVTLPLGNGEFYTFSTNGDVYSFNAVNAITSGAAISPDLVAHTDSIITDAEWLSNSEFVVSDPVLRNIAFYNFFRQETPILTGTWTPPAGELEMLFEPVALDRYANWLAVADRGNNRVYVLDLNSLGINNSNPDFFSVNVALIRDVLWSPLGELFALTENGEIFQLEVNFTAKSISKGAPLWSDFANAWSLFQSTDGGLYCIDIVGTKLWKAMMLPSQSANFGFLSLYHPVLAVDATNENFLIDATLTSPFMTYIQSAQESIHCIWNERSLSAMTFWKDAPVLDAVLLHGPLTGDFVPPQLRALPVTDENDIRVVLPPIWSLHKGTLTNIIVDSSIDFTPDRILELTCFCLMNGLEIDIWARALPSFALTRASAITGGRTLYALNNPLPLSAPKTRLQVQIPLPEELSSSGYPSRSMLSVYMDIGLVQTRCWIPLWPDTL